MNFDYEEYLKLCDKKREENQKYLDLFECELNKQGLKDRTIRRQVNDIDFYINEYLLREDIMPMEKGCLYADMFLGFFFIRKCMWSSPEGIRKYITALKKFYKCMLNNGHIEQSDYDCLLDDINDNKEEWIRYCEQYNDPNCEDPFELEMREIFGDF